MPKPSASGPERSVMRKAVAPLKSPMSSVIKRLLVFLLTTVSVGNLVAHVVYVTSRPQPRGKGPNTDGTYNDSDFADDTTAFCTAPGAPPRTGSRYFSTSVSNSTPDYRITITPTI